ncbi:hypothetical protein RISK_002507 [Rhodopirellula islandica]|uniref:Uncharacterized protein n=1 Tax=Rhodopirellula islandica TaxID=595434 RepID=A0A0J1BH52_RHOIS|nr:hypothetical protein RISK_002507 [Rhodopirellula islandica]
MLPRLLAGDNPTCERQPSIETIRAGGLTVFVETMAAARLRSDDWRRSPCRCRGQIAGAPPSGRWTQR